jgi:hypothetical protein
LSSGLRTFVSKVLKYLTAMIALIGIVFMFCADPDTLLDNVDSLLISPRPKSIRKLLKAYPDFLDNIDGNYLVWKDGSCMIIEDSIPDKTFEQKFETADIAEQMEMKYIKGSLTDTPTFNHDPGRIRNEAFFRKMYGATEKEATKNLVPVVWLPKTLHDTLLATSVNGVAKKLQEISDELDTLPELKKYLVHPGGTFLWRTIKGTKNLSMHSFGIAIDINTAFSNYWLWELEKIKEKPGPNGKIPYKNRIPIEIVKIFEKRGFIWGGKWYHYDTMHFEYRPELL